MAKPTQAEETPACYAMVHEGLESVAVDEITRDLGAEVKKAERGLVVFRPRTIGPELLKLRTVEDVYLLAWGTDTLTYRASDLDQIQQWTRKTSTWKTLFRIHQLLKPPLKSRPTFHLVCQMQGKHAYRRVDAAQAMAKGLQGNFPEPWRPVRENAYLEIWLTIRGTTAVCGVRLSDRTMRHRKYKTEHLPASLRPTIAASMVRLAAAEPDQIVVDPMCGAGTILAEQIELASLRRYTGLQTWGGDIDANTLLATQTNLKKLNNSGLARWDATKLPLARHSVDRIISNPPFGIQLGNPDNLVELYEPMIREADRVLKPGGKAVYLVTEGTILRDLIRAKKWIPGKELRIRVLGQLAFLSVWRKPETPESM
jgi:tRNA (guanine6-N2)-methyltransferase